MTNSHIRPLFRSDPASSCASSTGWSLGARRQPRGRWIRSGTRATPTSLSILPVSSAKIGFARPIAPTACAWPPGGAGADLHRRDRRNSCGKLTARIFLTFCEGPLVYGLSQNCPGPNGKRRGSPSPLRVSFRHWAREFANTSSGRSSVGGDDQARHRHHKPGSAGPQHTAAHISRHFTMAPMTDSCRFAMWGRIFGLVHDAPGRGRQSLMLDATICLPPPMSMTVRHPFR